MLILLILLTITGCSSRQSVQRTSNGAPRVQEISQLRLPAGFKIDAYATGLDRPRLMALSPDGRLFVTEMGAGRVTILPKSGGFASSHITYASGLNQPHGIAFHGGYLYVAETGRVIRFPYRNGDNQGRSRQVVISGIPTGGRHTTRTISFGPDGRLYLSVGSSCNVCVESNPMRAAISRFNADGTGKSIIATGLRNSVGHAWNPSTGQLWATDNGRDNIGDNIPPDEVNVIRPGGFYGWPYAYGNRVPDP
jgi:glucose/arabinose dehydrogenase